MLDLGSRISSIRVAGGSIRLLDLGSEIRCHKSLPKQKYAAPRTFRLPAEISLPGVSLLLCHASEHAGARLNAQGESLLASSFGAAIAFVWLSLQKPIPFRLLEN